MAKQAMLFSRRMVASAHPDTPGLIANSAPASGSRASSSAVSPSREVVMKSVERSLPPNAQQVGFLTGTSITRSRRPSVSVALDPISFPHRIPDKSLAVDARAIRNAGRRRLRDGSAAAEAFPSLYRIRRPRLLRVALSANHIVRPSGEKQVPLAQPTSPKSRVTVRSASSRQTDEIRAKRLFVHATRDEAALPIGAAVIEPCRRQVRLERRDRRRARLSPGRAGQIRRRSRQRCLFHGRPSLSARQQTRPFTGWDRACSACGSHVHTVRP